MPQQEVRINDGAQNQEQNQIVIDLHSNEVHEILSYVPNWIIRWGITVIFISIMMLFAMSWFIKYPDVVPGRVKITSTNPPATVVSKATGSLQLFVSDTARVDEGDLLALVKSPTVYDDVIRLQASLESVRPDLDEGTAINSSDFNENWQLGMLQPYFNNFIRSVNESKLVNSSAQSNKTRKKIIQDQIKQFEAIGKKRVIRVETLQRDYQKSLGLLENRYKKLFQSGSISAEQLEQKQNELIEINRAIQMAKTSLNENETQLLNLKREKAELGFKQKDQSIVTSNTIADAFNNLTGQITLWEEQFLLRAPITGQVSFLQFVKNNTYVQPNQELMTVVPLNKKTMFGELIISEAGAGKVEVGQVVNIVFDSYLKKEFGVVKGSVSKISSTAISVAAANAATPSNAYLIKVDLPTGLITSVKKNIAFKHDMEGKAEIITKDLRLVERIFNELRTVFEN